MVSLHVDTARTWRGGQRQVLLTARGLRARGQRAALVAHPDGELRRRAADLPDLYPIAPHAEMDLAAAWRLSRVMRDLRPDIVHAHDAHAVAMAVLARGMAGERRPAALVAARRVDFHLGANALSRWKYRQVDCFICASACIQSILAGDGIPAQRTEVVLEGIDLEQVSAAPPLDVHQAFGLLPGVPIVGNVAALVPHKGQRHLIDAAAHVHREVPDARFLIVGEGSLEASLKERITRHRLDRHVILTGFRPDVLSLHKGLDLFVMSSVTEGLGTSVLDAMACGRAVVATRAGGLPEAVEDGVTGLLVPVRDPRALADAIVKMLADSALRASYGQAGATRVRERFGAERMVDETVAVYQALVGARSGSGATQASRDAGG